MNDAGRIARVAYLAALIISLILTDAARARAQANDRSSPLGGRSALMGNTGVALGRDGAAPFLNPATVVGIDDRRLAFSVNFLALQVNHFKDWHQPSSVDPRFGEVSLGERSISSSRITTVPSTLCLFLSLSALKEGAPKDDPTPWKGGRQKFAVCLATLESEDLVVPGLSVHAPTTAGTTAQAVSLSRKWNRVHVGPSYSAQVNDKLALGASLQVAYTTMSFVQDASSITSTIDGSAVQSSFGAAGNGSSIDLTAIVGGTFRLGGVTFGASMQIPSLHLSGKYAATLHQSFDAQAESAATIARGSGTFRAKPPVRIAVGVGKAFERLTIEANASFTFGYREALASSMHVDSTSTAQNALTTSSFEAKYTTRALPTLNAAIGGEYFMSRRLSVLGGLWTNVSPFAPLSPEPAPSLGNLVQGRAHRVGLSLGLGSYGDGGELLFGTQLGYGWGQSIVANLYSVPNDWSVVSSSNFSTLFIIAGSTNLRAIKSAIEGVGKALAPDPDPEPAPTPTAPAPSK
ncbi:MAG TPA: hypothetical protein VJV79_21485 [Polyangiaceae bacterium]|nr:hypothetical protein [Polyangiaceae bacterium]